MGGVVNQLRARVGGRVKGFRRLKGWSQEQLGERAGLSYKFIGEIERGAGNPTIDTLHAIAVALDVDITDLFGPPNAARRDLDGGARGP